MSRHILSIEIRYENDLVSVRQRARQISDLLGFDDLDQARISTAVSEIARNALNYAGGGQVEFLLEESGPDQLLLRIIVSDQGPGIADLADILEGRLRHTGAGLGITSARRLMDRFRIDSAPGRGSTVYLEKRFPRSQAMITAADLVRIQNELARRGPQNPFEEIRRQNQELVRAMDELRARQEELLRLNRELEDTNRGVLALYAELDEKAVHLQRADELKSRFLSNMSHEFRTPLNSILALSRMLLDRVDGDLNQEQAKQVAFLQKNAQDLSELVNDLLDLAKVEAGRITVTPVRTEVTHLFAGLRGMFRPLTTNPLVTLTFAEPDGIPPMFTDEGKVSQILRNFISNALKFTERGEVRVSARFEPASGMITFAVSDTGIGIAPEHHERIFEEFAQVDHPIQKKVKGTGLGLPLARRLTELLGGSISVTSEAGQGSTFFATIPLVFRGAALSPAEAQVEADVTRFPVLIVEDNSDTRLLYEKFLKGSGFQILPAGSVEEARARLEEVRPLAVILDILLPGGAAWEFLVDLKRNPATRDIPVFVVSVLEEAKKGRALGADDYCVKPVHRKWLLDRLNPLAARAAITKVLIIDDDEVSRYLMRELLADTRYQVLEAPGGAEGLQLARQEKPQAILLDLLMPGMSGFEVLDQLKSDPATREIPVIIVTSKALTDQEKLRLSQKTAAILSKQTASRQEAIANLREALRKAEKDAGPGGVLSRNVR